MKYLNLFLLLIVLTTSCKKNIDTIRTINDSIVPDSLKINQIQVLGTHNSYRIMADKDIYETLLTLQALLPPNFDVDELDYTHISLSDQFYDYGIRQIELDLYLDPEGGLFFNRKGYEMVQKNSASNISELNEPGIKIMHIPDIDFNTHNISFVNALEEIKSFSDANPSHLPITIMLELKRETIDDYLPNLGFVDALPWEFNDFMFLEEEILSVFDHDNIIKPDDIRKNEATLKQAVLQDNWPTVKDARGKIMFVFINTDAQNNIYKQGAPSLENRLCFTNANESDDDAAFLQYDNPLDDLLEIQEKAALGYLIRTRSDAGTIEARTGDYSRWNSSLNSGAQFISTDYYKPDYRSSSSNDWSSYSVGFENGLYRMNPVFE